MQLLFSLRSWLFYFIHVMRSHFFSLLCLNVCCWIVWVMSKTFSGAIIRAVHGWIINLLLSAIIASESSYIFTENVMFYAVYNDFFNYNSQICVVSVFIFFIITFPHFLRHFCHFLDFYITSFEYFESFRTFWYNNCCKLPPTIVMCVENHVEKKFVFENVVSFVPRQWKKSSSFCFNNKPRKEKCLNGIKAIKSVVCAGFFWVTFSM